MANQIEIGFPPSLIPAHWKIGILHNKQKNKDMQHSVHMFSTVVYDFLYSRSPKVIEAIAEAIRNAPGVTLLDVDPGESTNRTVRSLITCFHEFWIYESYTRNWTLLFKFTVKSPQYEKLAPNDLRFTY